MRQRSTGPTFASLTIMRMLHGARDAAALIGDSEDKT
jgi:hypothetical protein